jgi:hypothetical protein
MYEEMRTTFENEVHRTKNTIAAKMTSKN